MNKLQKIITFVDKAKITNITVGIGMGISFIAILLQLVFNLNDDTLEKDIVDKKFIPFFVIFIVLIMMASISFIIKFLYNETSSLIQEKDLKDDLRRRRREHARLNQIINQENTSQINLQDLREIENRISTNLELRYEAHLKFKALQKNVSYILSPLVLSNQKYINTIQRNSIINLVIGIVGTLVAVIILSFAVLTNREYTNVSEFLVHILPRITFVAFIQVFAFFFLRLYKNNLEDGKYFQNELTNLNAKCAALNISIILEDKEKQSEILSNLAITERNFKIQKEETILNLEKAKIEKEYDSEMLNLFKDFLKDKTK